MQIPQAVPPPARSTRTSPTPRSQVDQQPLSDVARVDIQGSYSMPVDVGHTTPYTPEMIPSFNLPTNTHTGHGINQIVAASAQALPVHAVEATSGGVVTNSDVMDTAVCALPQYPPPTRSELQGVVQLPSLPAPTSAMIHSNQNVLIDNYGSTAGNYSTSSYGSGSSGSDNGSNLAMNDQNLAGAPAIMLAGLTGSGKSTFVSLLTGTTNIIGHDLTSRTTEIATYATTIAGTTVRLIDTPGFDDTSRSDTDILSILAVMLAGLYRQRIPLLGILYLHRISDPRVGGASHKSFRILEAICGPAAYHGVSLVTTMWDKLSSPEEGNQRVTQLQGNPTFFGALYNGGASVVRHGGENLRASAEAIIIQLLEKNRRQPVILQLQRELVDRNIELEGTAAGQIVDAGIRQQQQRAQQEIADLEQALLEANDKSSIEQLREEHQTQLNQLEQLSKARAGLRGGWKEHMDHILQLSAAAGDNDAEAIVPVANDEFDHNQAEIVDLRGEVELLKDQLRRYAQDTQMEMEINLLQVKQENRKDRNRMNAAVLQLQRELDEKTAHLKRIERDRQLQARGAQRRSRDIIAEKLEHFFQLIF